MGDDPYAEEDVVLTNAASAAPRSSPSDTKSPVASAVGSALGMSALTAAVAAVAVATAAADADESMSSDAAAARAKRDTKKKSAVGTAVQRTAARKSAIRSIASSKPAAKDIQQTVTEYKALVKWSTYAATDEGKASLSSSAASSSAAAAAASAAAGAGDDALPGKPLSARIETYSTNPVETLTSEEVTSKRIISDLQPVEICAPMFGKIFDAAEITSEINAGRCPNKEFGYEYTSRLMREAAPASGAYSDVKSDLPACRKGALCEGVVQCAITGYALDHKRLPFVICLLPDELSKWQQDHTLPADYTARSCLLCWIAEVNDYQRLVFFRKHTVSAAALVCPFGARVNSDDGFYSEYLLPLSVTFYLGLPFRFWAYDTSAMIARQLPGSTLWGLDLSAMKWKPSSAPMQPAVQMAVASVAAADVKSTTTTATTTAAAARDNATYTGAAAVAAAPEQSYVIRSIVPDQTLVRALRTEWLDRVGAKSGPARDKLVETAAPTAQDFQ